MASDRRSHPASAAALTVAMVLAACGSGIATPTFAPTSTVPAPEPRESASSSVRGVAPWDPPEHVIVVDDGRFMERSTGETFTPRGVNYFLIVSTPEGGLQDRFFSPAHFDRERVAADFARLADAGFNTVRLFLDSCSSGPDCIGNTAGDGLDDEFLDVIAETMALARETGIFLLLTSNDLPDAGGYWPISDRANGEHFPGYRNTQYLTVAGHEATVAYWADLLDGLIARRAAFDAVLGWSILNEQWLFGDQPPLSLVAGSVATAAGVYDVSDPEQRRSMVVDNLRRFIAAVAATIRERDPTAPVTMGFFAPRFPNPTETGGTWYVDTAPLMEDAELDFLDFHAYPGGDIGFPEIAENFGVTDAKPVLMGEVGAFVDRYASVEQAGLAVQRWIADSCEAGFDGWLYWGYLRAPAEIGDATWSLTDADGYLLEALSPAEQPEACTPTLEDPNLASGGTVTASNTLVGEPATNAVDGGPAQWGSGGDAPQWIEVQLREPSPVGSVELVAAQFPAGRTLHVVEIRRSDGSLVEVHRFDGTTDDGDVLRVDLAEPTADAVAVRITTLVSPSWVSWREVIVLGAP